MAHFYADSSVLVKRLAMDFARTARRPDHASFSRGFRMLLKAFCACEQTSGDSG